MDQIWPGSLLTSKIEKKSEAHTHMVDHGKRIPNVIMISYCALKMPFCCLCATQPKTTSVKDL